MDEFYRKHSEIIKASRTSSFSPSIYSVLSRRGNSFISEAPSSTAMLLPYPDSKEDDNLLSAVISGGPNSQDIEFLMA